MARNHRAWNKRSHFWPSRRFFVALSKETTLSNQRSVGRSRTYSVLIPTFFAPALIANFYILASIASECSFWLFLPLSFIEACPIPASAIPRKFLLLLFLCLLLLPNMFDFGVCRRVGTFLIIVDLRICDSCLRSGWFCWLT